jgi:hypothetical protein
VGPDCFLDQVANHSGTHQYQLQKGGQISTVESFDTADHCALYGGGAEIDDRRDTSVQEKDDPPNHIVHATLDEPPPMQDGT